MSSPPLSVESLAQVVQQLQIQTVNQQVVLSESNKLYKRLKRLDSQSTLSGKPKKYNPENYNGESSVTSRTIRMEDYPKDARENESLPLAVSYMTGAIHEWWIVFKESID